MKMLAVWILFMSLGFATQAMAQSQSNRSDLMYLPQAGTLFGTSEASFGVFNTERQISPTSTSYVKTDFKQVLLKQTIGFSLLDNLSLEAGITFSPLFKGDIKSANTVTSYKEDGIGDPTIQARFRLLNAQYLFDVRAFGSFNIEDTDSRTRVGSVGLGGHSAGLGVDLGRKSDDSQFAISVDVRAFLEQTSKFQTTTLKTDTFYAANLRFARLVTLADKLMFNAFFDFGYVTSIKDNANNLIGSSLNYSAGVDFRYVLTDRVVIRPSLEYSTVSGFVKYDNATAAIAADFQL
jgi:hypothetical protein